MIGIFNKDSRRTHIVHQTKFEDDMNSESLQVAWKHATDVPTIIHTYQFLDNKSFAPIGRIALYADMLNLRAAKRLLQTHLSEGRIIGRCVDCIYFHPPYDASWIMVEELEAAETLSSGESRFRIQAVQNSLNKVPRKPRSPDERDCTESIESLRWTVVREDDRGTGYEK